MEAESANVESDNNAKQHLRKGPNENFAEY